MKLDRFDIKILEVLQRDASLSLAQIARAVALSQTPCWKRIRRLQDAGMIKRRVVLLDEGIANLALTAFVSLSIDRHRTESYEELRRIVSEVPQIVGCYRMSGDVDFLLCIKVPDIAAYDAVYKHFIAQIDRVSHIKFSAVQSRFALETLKNTTELPLDYVGQDFGSDRAAGAKREPRP